MNTHPIGLHRLYKKHFESTVTISALPEEVFAFIDDHSQFSSHMNNSSWMMGGSRMETEMDELHGQQVGSHIKMKGNIFGVNIFLDEIVTQREPPLTKSWETVGSIKVIVIDHYRMRVSIEPHKNTQSKLTVAIDYNLPQKNFWVEYLFSGMYAKWCVGQMINGTSDHFSK